jgi:undecaprenyl pyrophosphate phosphatase UppP
VAKIAAGFVERLDRIADTLFAFLLPGPAILAATRLAEIKSFDPG